MTIKQTKDLRTSMMGKIIQLDYDWITSQEGCCSYCLTDGQVQMVLSVIDYFGWSTRWYSESGLVDQKVINELQAGLAEALMNGCGCGDDLEQLKRLTPEGHWQTSNDNGFTWDDASTGDPRRAVPIRPLYPALPDGEDTPLCEWSDSIVELMKMQFVSILNNEMTVRDVLAALSGLLLAVLPIAGVTSLLIGLTALPAIIIGFGILAMQSAFTEAVWNRLRCNIFDNMDANGLGTQGQVDAIYNRVGSEETGITKIVIQQIIALFGVQGMQNAAAAGFGSGEADCDCSESCADNFDILNYGVVVERGDDYIIVDSQLIPDGRQQAILNTDDTMAVCCTILEVNNVVGDFDFFYYNCGNPEASIGLPVGHSIWRCYGLSLAPFRMKVTFG